MSLSTSCIRDIDEIWFTAETAAPFGHLQFGIPVIDDALGGGVFSGRLTEIYGAAGSGKTQLALSLVAQELIRIHQEGTGALLLYFHTTGTFPITRLCEIIESKLNASNGSGTVDKSHVKAALKNLCLDKVVEPAELMAKLHNLCNTTDESPKLRLLVVDSIASIFRPYMHIKGVAGNNVNNILSVASLLKRLAHQMDVAILVINEVTRGGSDAIDPTSGLPTSVKPALGDLWTQCINCRISMQARKGVKFTRRFLRIVFNSNGPPSGLIEVGLTALGVQPC